MSKEAMKLALEAAYLAGFNASGEGYNAEYPFNDHAKNPEEDAAWIKDRDNALREALAEQPAQPQQEPVAWPCLIAEADFSEDTVTLAMQCTDYKVSAGKHWLSNTPPAQQCWKCGDMDAEFQAKCNVPACGMKEQP